MALYIVRRMGTALLLLWGLSILIFGITHVLPGDVARAILGQYATPDAIEALQVKLGLGDPLYTQYARWFGGVIRGDFGTSLLMDRPVGPIIVEHLARSVWLAGGALLGAATIGIFFGVVSAVWRNHFPDHFLSFVVFLGISVPEFFWGIVLIVLISAELHLLPSSGYVPISEGIGPWLAHLALPVATLIFVLLAHIARITRSSMIEVLQSNYVLYARAKGMPRRRVLYRHALRNALIPPVTVLALNLGWLTGGIVVIETVFAIPGFGKLMVTAIRERDLPLIEASVLVVSAVYCFANLIADVLYTYLDPRIRYAASEG